MRMNLADGPIDVFTINPRTTDQVLYWRDIQTVTRLSQKFDCTGVLIFTGNDVYVDPWLVAHQLLNETETLCPLIAVNPVYMHPFTAAKMISSFAYLYKRKVYLNLVTGTALSYLEALGDGLSHDERYERLQEYVQIVSLLLSGPGLVNFSGKYYQVSNLFLLPSVPAELFPGFLIAGQSEAAQRICAEVGGTGMQMLKPQLEQAVTSQRGIHFGIVTRGKESEAWEAAKRLYPEDEEGREVLDFSMGNTDSVWKRDLKGISDDPRSLPPNYWLTPFRNLKADCPTVVGDYEYVAGLLVRLIERGIRTFILEIAPQEQEFYHINVAFEMAAKRIFSGDGALAARPREAVEPDAFAG
ncbi:MAG TPA: LLM class flavin-dependent oxidoreductase [Blastocatellia bacterium]|nr:LLM class flavin-dependent oxidoreductase [Blastocatellia bacterium]